MERIKVYYCYAHEDKKLRDELDKHLMSLKQLEKITLRLNHEIIAGTNWRHMERFQEADLILLLISQNFVSKDFHYKTEIYNALEKHEAGHVSVIPILLRHTSLLDQMPIGNLQMLPKDGIPLHNQRDRDAALVNIIREIGGVVATILTRKQEQALVTKTGEGKFPKFTQVIGSPCTTCGSRNPLGVTNCENCGDLLLEALPPQKDTNNQSQADERKLCYNMAFVIDHSASMKGAKLRDARETVKMAIDRLEPKDYISVVIFDDTAQVIIPSMPANDKPGMKAAIDKIQDAGGTTMCLGMTQGLGEVRRWVVPNAIKSMILLTDGFTYGDTDRCRQLAKEASLAGVAIHTVPFGSSRDQELLDNIEELSGGIHANFPSLVLPFADKLRQGGKVKAVLKKVNQNIAFVIDHSGSMEGLKLEKIREVVKMAIDRLEPEDYISVVIFNDTAQVIIPSMPANDKPGMKAAIDKIQSKRKWITLSIGGDGNTKMSRGMVQVLTELRRWDVPNTSKRMILLTDGLTYGDADRCRQLAKDAAATGTAIHTVPFGFNRNQDLLDDIEELGGNVYGEFSHFLGVLSSEEVFRKTT